MSNTLRISDRVANMKKSAIHEMTRLSKAILYCSPSNPTGTIFSGDELRGLAKIALDHDLMVITDEAYEYFTFDRKNHFSIGSFPEMNKCLNRMRKHFNSQKIIAEKTSEAPRC